MQISNAVLDRCIPGMPLLVPVLVAQAKTVAVLGRVMVSLARGSLASPWVSLYFGFGSLGHRCPGGGNERRSSEEVLLPHQVQLSSFLAWPGARQHPLLQWCWQAWADCQ